MKNCKSCGAEFDFYPGERCGYCAPRHARMVECLWLLGSLFVGLVLGFIFCAMVYRF